MRKMNNIFEQDDIAFFKLVGIVATTTVFAALFML